MKRLLGITVATAVCALSTVIGLTIFTAAGTIGLGGDYDMPPEQTEKFLITAAGKLGGHKLGGDKQVLAMPSLPWKAEHILFKISPKSTGSHVELYGHATKVKELKTFLDSKLVPLSAP